MCGDVLCVVYDIESLISSFQFFYYFYLCQLAHDGHCLLLLIVEFLSNLILKNPKLCVKRSQHAHLCIIRWHV